MKRASLLVLGLTLLVAGCPSFSDTGRYPCNSNSDCPHNRACLSSHLCQPVAADGGTNPVACGTTADCSGFAGSNCVNGSCELTCGPYTCAGDEVCAPGGGYCVKADHTLCPQGDECPVGFRCGADGNGHQICLRPCSGPGDCLPGWTCDAAPDGQGQACRPNECGPDPSAPQGTQRVPFGSVATRCQVTTGPSAIQGSCVGPLSDPALASSHDGLCFGDGLVTEGHTCNSLALYGDGSQQCIATLTCVPPLKLSTTVGDPSGPHTCMSLCGGMGAPTCPSDARCWPLWADLGVCVAQHGTLGTLGEGAPCGPAYGSTGNFPDTRPCSDGLLCVPDISGGSTGHCHAACSTGPGAPACPTSGATCSDVSSLAPGAPASLGYCH